MICKFNSKNDFTEFLDLFKLPNQKSMCYQYNDKYSFGCTVLYIFITSIPLMFWYSVGKILWLLFSVNVQYVGPKQFSTISLLKKENWFLPNGNICISILSSSILVLPTLCFQRSYSYYFEVKYLGPFFLTNISAPVVLVYCHDWWKNEVWWKNNGFKSFPKKISSQFDVADFTFAANLVVFVGGTAALLLFSGNEIHILSVEEKGGSAAIIIIKKLPNLRWETTENINTIFLGENTRSKVFLFLSEKIFYNYYPLRKAYPLLYSSVGGHELLISSCYIKRLKVRS